MRFTPALRHVLLLFALGVPPTLCLAQGDKNFHQANKSVADAMTYIGIEPDKHDTYKNSVKGGLPTDKQKALVDSMIRIHAGKSVPEFLNLHDKPSLAALKQHVGNDAVVDGVVGAVRNGHYLGVPPGTRYFASYQTLSEADKAQYKGRAGMKFDPLPTAIMTFYHFDRAKQRLLGTRFEVAEAGRTYTLVLPTFDRR